MKAKITLDDAWDKLRWSRHHFDTLRAEIEPIEQRDRHRFSFEVDPDAFKYTFHVHELEDIPATDWGLLIGDCLHNARTALDYLAVRLWGVVTGEDPREIERLTFPICEELSDFASNPTVSRFRKEAALSGYLTRIEELQPFNGFNRSIWGVDQFGHFPPAPFLPTALSRLSYLDNIDKHRVIHAAWVGIKAVPTQSMTPPKSFGGTGGRTNLEALENGAEVGELTFAAPFPHEWHPSQMEMKRHFPLEVAFDEPLPAKGVLEVLAFCLWGVESTLRLFDPVFTHSAPPLPVTATIPVYQSQSEP